MGQHAGITQRILEDFELSAHARSLLPGQTTVEDYNGAVKWLLRIGRHLISPGRMRKELFDQPGIVLVHGDTLSTLLGALIARRLGFPMALVEAGLTSGTLWYPFPEELIRRACEYLAHIAFAPGGQATARLQTRPRTRVIDTVYNTGRDALLEVLDTKITDGTTVLATVHRLETLRNRLRLARVVEYITSCATDIGPVEFVLHPPTWRALKSSGHLRNLENNAHVQLTDLLPYRDFLRRIAGARAVLTDGGSVQEECSYLAKPCIVLREQTERPHGIGKTCVLTAWDVHLDFARLSELQRDAETVFPAESASARIIDTLRAERTQCA